MNFIDFSRNYQRFFRYDNYCHLFNDAETNSYSKFGVLVLTLGENTTFYFPKTVISQTLQEGAELFADESAFQEYQRQYEEFMPVFEKFFHENIEGRSNVDRASTRELTKW